MTDATSETETEVTTSGKAVAGTKSAMTKSSIVTAETIAEAALTEIVTQEILEDVIAETTSTEDHRIEMMMGTTLRGTGDRSNARKSTTEAMIGLRIAEVDMAAEEGAMTETAEMEATALETGTAEMATEGEDSIEIASRILSAPDLIRVHSATEIGIEEEIVVATEALKEADLAVAIEVVALVAVEAASDNLSCRKIHTKSQSLPICTNSSSRTIWLSISTISR